jgi:UDP-N-acetylmuramate dehydrogenase
VTPLDGVTLAPLTTLGLGGPARHFIAATDEETLIEALRWAHARRLSVLVLGGGSNLVVGDAGFDGLALQVATRGLGFADGGGETAVTAAAGEPWDALVAAAVTRNLAGLECLSGIPGLVGATPIQNVGAYGQEVAETIRAVRVLERGSWRVHELSPTACGFGYRDSAFKRDPERFVVLGVTFGLRPEGAPTLRYRELADALRSRARPTLGETRQTVIALRGAKSMVLREDDPNRRSVGSFFTNPVVPAADAAAVADRSGAGDAMPRWPGPDGRVKLSAGWLIERAGFGKGLRRGPVGISSAHALALVHHGGGTTVALLTLAREIRDGVRTRFGVTLVPEPTLVGVRWEP